MFSEMVDVVAAAAAGDKGGLSELEREGREEVNEGWVRGVAIPWEEGTVFPEGGPGLALFFNRPGEGLDDGNLG